MSTLPPGSRPLDLLQGTLDLLILRTLALGPMHGCAISQRIQQMSDEVLRVEDLHVHYATDAGLIRAAQGVSFSLRAEERLGLVGESGSGKSTTVLALLRMIKPPGRIAGGKVILDGVDLLARSEAQMRATRFAGISLIPQGAMNSLNPVMRIRNQIEDTIRYHDRWFWIDYRDFRSKALFTFLYFLTSLTETGVKEGAPIVTIPIN